MKTIVTFVTFKKKAYQKHHGFRAGLTNMGALFRKIIMGSALCKTNTFSHVCTREYSSAYFQKVCSEIFSLFLLVGNFDLINFFRTRVGSSKVCGPLFGRTCSNIP